MLYLFPQWVVVLGVCHLWRFSSAFAVTRTKNHARLQSDAFHEVKAEGDAHSLAMKRTRPSDAGPYGRAACSAAALHVQSGESGPEATRLEEDRDTTRC